MQQAEEDDALLQLFRKGFQKFCQSNKPVTPVNTSPVSSRFICEEEQENPPIAPESYQNNFKKFWQSVSVRKSSGTSTDEILPPVNSLPSRKPNSSIVYEKEEKRLSIPAEYMRQKLIEFTKSISVIRKDLPITENTSKVTEIENSCSITPENLDKNHSDTMVLNDTLSADEKQNHSHHNDQSPLKSHNASSSEFFELVKKTPEKSCSNQENGRKKVKPLMLRRVNITPSDKENVKDLIEENNSSIDLEEFVKEKMHSVNIQKNRKRKENNCVTSPTELLSDAEEPKSNKNGLNVSTRSKVCTTNKASKMSDTDTDTEYADIEYEICWSSEDDSAPKKLNPKSRSSANVLPPTPSRRSKRISHKMTQINYDEEDEHSASPPKTRKLTENANFTPRSSKRRSRKNIKILCNEEDEHSASAPKTRNSTENANFTPRSSKRISQRKIQVQYNEEDGHSASPPRTPKLKKDTDITRRSSMIQRTPKTPSTPKLSDTPRTSRRNIRNLTPMIPNGEGVSCSPMTPRDKALMALHISSAPDSLPCREVEFKTIYDFVNKKIKELSGGVMCIYGNPGIGKTATVERVMKKLQCEAKQKKMKPFKQIEMNGMHLTRPKDAYCLIWDKLGNGKVSAKKAQVALENKFSSSRSKDDVVVLIIDEFDFLWNKSQDVINDIFEWLICSKLIILAIANTKDILERMKNSKAGDRKVLENSCNLCFNPYSSLQLEEIIKDRLKGNDIFEAKAVEFLAKKAACSGDARRALNLCRRVVAIAENGTTNNSINIHRVSQILQEIQTIPEVIFIKKNLCTHEKFLLKAIRDVLCNSGLSKMSLDRGGIYHQYKALGTLEGNATILSEMQLILQIHSLKRKGLIKVSDNSVTINTEISLSVDPDYIHMALEPPKN